MISGPGNIFFTLDALICNRISNLDTLALCDDFRISPMPILPLIAHTLNDPAQGNEVGALRQISVTCFSPDNLLPFLGL